jgi:hypothetical protein
LNVRRVGPIALASIALVSSSACSRTYHPEYHPETSYSYVQSTTYVKNAIYAAPTPTGSVSSPGAVVIYGSFSGNIYLEH